jgi:hypothetical protein
VIVATAAHPPSYYADALIVPAIIVAALVVWANRPVRVGYRPPRTPTLGPLLRAWLAARLSQPSATWGPPAQREVRLRGGTSASRPALQGLPPERMPAPRYLSEDYDRYISRGLEPLEPANRAAWDQILWSERMRLFLAHHKRSRGGWCEDGRRCGGRSQATQGHHLDYSELFHETRRTVELVCRPCHVQAEQDKRRAGR